jgi:putative ABC transport system permease protein
MSSIFLQRITHDLRFGARLLLRNPGLTAVAVLSLAAGIGTNTAVFTIIDAIMLRDLPVRNPGELVMLTVADRRGVGSSFSYPAYVQLQESAHALSGTLAFSQAGKIRATVDGEPELTSGQLVTGGYFPLLGVAGQIGRMIGPDDDRPGVPAVAVISDGYWTRRFGRSQSVIGRQINLSDHPFTVIGVTPPGFFGLVAGTATDISVPLTFEVLFQNGRSRLTQAGNPWLKIFGRLKPGAGLAEAQVDLGAAFQRFQAEPLVNGSVKRDSGVASHLQVESGRRGAGGLRAKFGQPLLIVMVLAGLVLLMACGNIANLYLERALGRRHEMAVRLSIGASRANLIAQVLTECSLIALLGGVGGLLLSVWESQLLLSTLSQGGNPIPLNLTLDSRVLAFTAGVSLITVLLCGIAPAFWSTRIELSDTLKQGERDRSSRAARLSWGKPVAVLQLALSLVLLIGAGLLTRTLHNLRTLDAGFERENILLFAVNWRLGSPGARDAPTLHKEILDRISTIPGVVSASASGFGFLEGNGWSNSVFIRGYTSRQAEENVEVNPVAPSFFTTMGVPIIQGRDFTQQDMATPARTVIVNETMARNYFGAESPIGRRFGFGGPENSGAMEIIGVVRETRSYSLRDKPTPKVYLGFFGNPIAQQMTFALRSKMNPKGLIAQVRREIHVVDSSLPIFNVRTMTDQVEGSLTQERLVANLSGFFGVTALILACVGLYGLMAYTVVERTREIGIRLALGARPGDVTRMIMRELGILLLAGIVIGVPSALAAARLVSSRLFGLSATDPTTVLGAVLGLAFAATTIGYSTASKASRVDPQSALRMG